MTICIKREIRSVIYHSINCFTLYGENFSQQAMLSEDICKVNFFIFKLFGIWEPVNSNWLYAGWQIICLIFIGIGLPLSFFMSFIYTESSEDAMKIPVLLCTIISVSIKCILFFSKRFRLRELLKVLRKMDDYADTISEELMIEVHIRKVSFGEILCITYILYLEVLTKMIGFPKLGPSKSRTESTSVSIQHNRIWTGSDIQQKNQYCWNDQEPNFVLKNVSFSFQLRSNEKNLFNN